MLSNLNTTYEIWKQSNWLTDVGGFRCLVNTSDCLGFLRDAGCRIRLVLSILLSLSKSFLDLFWLNFMRARSLFKTIGSDVIGMPMNRLADFKRFRSIATSDRISLSLLYNIIWLERWHLISVMNLDRARGF